MLGSDPKPAVRRMGVVARWAIRASIMVELIRFLIRNGRFWLVPMVVVFVVSAVLLGAVQVLEYVAPFVYTMF